MAGKIMELKDLIKSTLEELDAKVAEESHEIAKKAELQQEVEPGESDERAFLLHTKERMEILFKGLKSPENKKADAKLALVINFLQYYLSQIDTRLDKLSK